MKKLLPTAHSLLSKKGFSFIELLVTISIMLVVIAVAIANFGGFNKSKRLTEAADQMAVNIRLVATRATSGDNPCGDQDFGGYQLETTSSTTYEVKPICDGSVVEDEAVEYELINEVQITNGATVDFYPLDQGASVNETISLSLNDLTTDVQIATSGGVYVDFSE